MRQAIPLTVVICLLMATPVRAAETTSAVDEKHALVPLYVSLGGLALADWQTTRVALRAGQHEANPLMAPLVGSAAALLVLKGSAAATSIILSSRMRAQHPKLALASMITANMVSTFVIVHNAAVINSRR